MIQLIFAKFEDLYVCMSIPVLKCPVSNKKEVRDETRDTRHTHAHAVVNHGQGIEGLRHGAPVRRRIRG